ncbi:MAG: HAMP domain-containing protein [Coriobacteriales bacterium]|jgi:signal transduction histidine kinase|nr:HAMP domain-containing protein [Coriobacteriales bacterium]
MKMTWKLFFSTLLITVLVFGAGGFALIMLTFNAALDRERTNALEEARLFRHTLQVSVSSLGEWQPDSAQSLAASLVSRFSSERLQLRVVQVGGSQAGFEPLSTAAATGGPGLLDAGEASSPIALGQGSTDSIDYVITRSDDAYYLQTVQLVEPLGVTLSIETASDISAVFAERAELFGIYRWLMLGMVAINGVLVFALARWTTAPIRSLSRATRSIAQGHYRERVPVRSSDEIGELTEDFNQMAEGLAQTVRELELSVEREHDFVASFAHELKTPLTSIIGYADLLRSGRLADDDAQLAASYIFSEGRRLESLSMKLLDLIVAQKRDFEMRKVSLPQLFQGVEIAVFPLLHKNGIDLSIQAAPVTVRCEPDLIQTLLLNLISNACKATPQGGHIRVEGGRLSEQQWRVVVDDDGAGIPREALPRITEAFYRADTSRSRAQGGAGLGLALCSEICTLHAGALNIESTEGAGTRVTAVLEG